MKVFLSGGTGAIGRHVVTALIASGHSVTALARTDEKASWLASQGARPDRTSLFDRSALTKALAGHDVAVNLATAIPPSHKFMSRSAWQQNDRVRIEGSSALVDAAGTAGVARFVQESVSMIYQDSGSDWIDEQSATDRFPMALGNHAAEASANRFAEAGGIGVVLRFGWFYGPGATHSEEFLTLARRSGICIMLGKAGGYLSSIHTHDAATAICAALDVDAGTYNVVDNEPLTKEEYADALGAASGRKTWLKAPGRIAYLLGHRTTSLTRSLRVSNQKFREASGWQPRYPSAREGWRATAELLPEAG